MTNRQRMKQLQEILEQLAVYFRSIGKLEFDMECCAPEEGIEAAGSDIAVLGQQIYKLEHSKKYTGLITALHEDPTDLSDVEKILVEHLYDRYAKTKNYTAKFSYEMDKVFAKAYGDWLSAKRSGDYGQFRDIFAKVVEYTRKSIDLRDNKPELYYNACLDDTEKDMDQTQLDAFFSALKARIVPLTKKIVAEGKPIREDFLTRPVPIPQQEAFSRYLLELEGLRKSALVLMTTEHPFTTSFGPNDVRVTTHYYEENFISNIFTTMHEGGHALFMQNEPKELVELHADGAMSNGMHECISRFYENIIGRSEEFIHFIYPKLLELSGDTFSDMTERELYEAVNIARPSLIRTEADELTYCLHILIRYEIEKVLVNGEITVDEVPALWNSKYQEYLGVEVPSDDLGCLQDVHWSGGFGYFPSYALGNAYGAQILHRMEQDFDVFAEVRKGRLDTVLSWLKEHVFARASLLTPDQWIREITGEPLNTDYFLDYLEKKFTALYQL